MYIKKDNEMDFEMVANISNFTAKKIKVEINSSSEEKFSKGDDILKRALATTLTGIKNEDDNLTSLTEIKVERDTESGDKTNDSKGKIYATIPEINYISVGEIKIEGGICKENPASETKSFNIELQPVYDISSESDEESTVKIKYEENSDGVYISFGENHFKEDDKATTSQKIKIEKTNIPAELENYLKIKQESNDESDSEEDIDDGEEFLSETSGGEEFLSDTEGNASNNQNLTVDNKPVVSELIDEYHKRPQLWFKELSADMSDSKETKLFYIISNTLNKKFNTKFNAIGIKNFINLLCAQYETEIERQLKENEETTAESSRLWFYDKLFFLKDDIENNVKQKLEKSLVVLDDNILAELIDIYKNYNDLWDANKSSFPDKQKRHETMQSMCQEIKHKMNISLNSFQLEYQLINLHQKLKEEKKERLACEMNEKEYAPSLSYITKCAFLQNHQAPFKCNECSNLFDTYRKFLRHKAKRDGISPLKCNICGIDCKSREMFNYHCYQHNGVNYSCSICGKHCVHPVTLKEHLIAVHVTRPKGNIFNCDICGKGFDRLRKVTHHKRYIHNQEAIQCKICGQICKNKGAYKYHKVRHDGISYECSICGKNYKHPKLLKCHMNEMHSSEQFKCGICEKVFDKKSKLITHKNTIHNPKSYKCKICDELFDTSDQVFHHKRLKHDQKPITCKICGQVCESREALKNHTCKPDENYERDMLLQGKTHKCDFCWKYFSKKYGLTRHIKLSKNHDNLSS